jgi:hypothetical protein
VGPMLSAVDEMLADLPNLTPGSGRWLMGECARECAARLDAGGGGIWMRELRSTVAHLAEQPNAPQGALDEIRAQRHRRRINAALAVRAAEMGE